MTCIVAISENNKIFMGADSLGTNYHTALVRNDRKIFKVKNMLIGFTSSYRMGQILGFSLVPPTHNRSVNTLKYMSTLFIDEVRRVLKDKGYSTVRNNEEIGGTFLVGYKGVIYQIDSDFQVGEASVNYAAVGSGEHLALGSLYTTDLKNGHINKYIKPEDRILGALGAAQEYNPGVREPFIIETI